MMMSQVIGNAFAAFFITKVKQSTFYIVLAVLAFAASIFFLALPTPKPIPKETDELNLVEPEEVEEVKKGEIR